MHREEPSPGDPADREEAVRLLSELTPQEREVLALVAQGSSTDEVAKALGIDRDRVRVLIRSIYNKLEEHSHTEWVCASPSGAF